METMVELSPTARKGPETTVVRKWFDVNTGADYCGVRPKTVRKAIKAGLIPRAKLGRKFVMSGRDLDAWVQGELVREN